MNSPTLKQTWISHWYNTHSSIREELTLFWDPSEGCEAPIPVIKQKLVNYVYRWIINQCLKENSLYLSESVFLESVSQMSAELSIPMAEYNWGEIPHTSVLYSCIDRQIVLDWVWSCRCQHRHWTSQGVHIADSIKKVLVFSVFSIVVIVNVVFNLVVATIIVVIINITITFTFL